MDPEIESAREYVDAYHAANWSGARPPRDALRHSCRHDLRASDAGHAGRGVGHEDQHRDAGRLSLLVRRSLPERHAGVVVPLGFERRSGPGTASSCSVPRGCGATGSHTAAECRRHALDLLHYFHGQNPLSMVYPDQHGLSRGRALVLADLPRLVRPVPERVTRGRATSASPPRSSSPTIPTSTARTTTASATTRPPSSAPRPVSCRAAPTRTTRVTPSRPTALATRTAPTETGTTRRCGLRAPGRSPSPRSDTRVPTSPSSRRLSSPDPASGPGGMAHHRPGAGLSGRRRGGCP